MKAHFAVTEVDPTVNELSVRLYFLTTCRTKWWV